MFAYDYFNFDVIESAHGRPPAVATAIKRLLPDRLVFTYQGDGDLISIGSNEILHAANRGEDITVIFVNNAIYGMTGGQMAPTTMPQQKTTTSPGGRNNVLDGYPIQVSEVFAMLPGTAYIERCTVNSPASMKQGLPRGVKAMVAGAAPPASMIEGMEALGFDLTHVYGLTEVYGPATVCAAQDGWEKLEIGERARLNARQGVRYHLERDVRVLDSQTLQPVPQDGETMGEIMFRGNIAMKGYLKNPKATEEAFAGGWFHSGDLAVMYPDGYIKIKDRSKDVIISGGENISSIEVEDVLYRHPDVLAAAVVAKPDERWGETPCAFVELKAGATATKEDIVAHCKKHLAGFKVPRAVVFGELPKTSTGKIQKFELRKLAGSAAAIDV